MSIEGIQNDTHGIGQKTDFLFKEFNLVFHIS